MNPFDIVSLDLFSTLVYVNRDAFNPHQALKDAILKSGELNSHFHIVDEIINKLKSETYSGGYGPNRTRYKPFEVVEWTTRSTGPHSPTGSSS